MRNLLFEEQAQGMVEYILIIAVVALIVIGGIKIFGEKLKGLFEKKAEELEQF
ncbi:Flp family type IVb pilin [candidate division FCPU426 bacterium]|nr:Flp family type IVb pilin [candidate division FCPU426 bacterium]